MILSQKHQSGTHSLPTETARQLNIDHSSVCRTMDQDLDLRPLGKCKVQKLTDSNIEKRLTHSRKLLSKYTQKALQTAIFTDEKIFKKISKVKQLHNSHNDMVYVPNMVFVEPNIKINGKHYCNSHRRISICICKIWYDFDRSKNIYIYYNFSERVPPLHNFEHAETGKIY